MSDKMKYLLQHGNFGEGPINPFIVSDSKEKLIERIKQIIPAEFIYDTHTFFDSENCIHFRLTKNFEYNGFTYNMFFIDAIQSI